ncbi:MAG: NapC/NirT family cytochrome c [Pseudomonadota bacterium]
MSEDDKSLWARLWSQPKSKWLLGIPLGGFLAVGVGAVGLGTTNYVLHATSTTEFCYACHSHEAFIKPEYETSSHFINISGVRASCADCHLPHDNWFELTWTKAVVSLDIIPEMMGKLDTAEKYESHRAEMAEAVWRQFKANDSKFCRHCHSVEAMDLEEQNRSVARRHERAESRGETCIDCHYGIVHELPADADDIMDRLGEEFAPETTASAE